MAPGTTHDFDFFSARMEPPILYISFRHNLLAHLMNISCREVMFDFYKHVIGSGNIKVIVVNSDFTNTGCDAYARFIDRTSRESTHLDLHRLINMTHQLIRGILAMDQFVIHVSCGHVISLFLNISMACDYRIASKDTVFCKPYLDLGVVPLGAGPFFISKTAGIGNAWDILLGNRDIPAEKALEMGLVDHIAPHEEISRATRKIAERYSQAPLKTITGLKRLINFNRQNIDGYFEMEKTQMLKTLV